MKKKLFLLMALLCCFVLAVGILAACNGDAGEQTGGQTPGGGDQQGGIDQPGDTDEPGGGDEPGDPDDEKPEEPVEPVEEYFTVTFNVNGGDSAISSREYLAGALMSLPTPIRDGYRFLGWYDAFGEKFDSSSLMPDNDLILYAQWEPVVTSYEDEFVYFKPATEGVKDPDTKLEYDDVTGFVYVELTSDMLGGRHKVGEENNFDFTRGVEMEYSVKSGYTLQWWRDRDFSVANGAQRFTLNYGSNFQFLTVGSNQQTQATYLIDFYVLHDYQVKLHTNIYDENPYETVWVIENRTFASDTEAYQMKDFEFDKRVYWDEDAGWGEWKAFDYSTPITQDWDLYQTYKPYTVEAELDGGTLDGELSIIPYTEYQQLPVPEKEGYDFIGWQLPDADNDKEDYFADITGFNSTLLLGGGRSTRTNVYFDTLTAAWLPKHYHKVTDGDEVSFEETVPVVTYTDRSMNEINEVIYVVKGTPYVLPEKVVYEGSLEFCGWKVWTQDNGGDYYGETFDFDAEVTEPAAMWQDMEVIGGSSSVNGLYLNDSRTFSSLGVGQRIKAYLPVQGDYTFTVTTTGTVNFKYNNHNYYAYSSEPVTFTVTNEKPDDGLQVFLDVSRYTDSFTIKFEGPTGTAVAPSESIADAVYVVGDAVTAPQKAGYTFVGWYDADGTKLSEDGSFDFAIPDDTDAVYTMKWQRCATKLAVSDEAAGRVSGLEGTTVVGGEVTVMATSAPCYEFVEWRDEQGNVVGNEESFTFTMTTDDVTYTAVFVMDPPTDSNLFTFKLDDSGTGYIITDYVGDETELVIPDEYNGLPITQIGSSAFKSSEQLIAIIIPDRVTSVGEQAFYNCTNLASVTIGDGVTSIGDNAFEGCSGLALIEVDVNNATYASVDGIMYNKAKTEFVLIPAALAGDVTIPAGVTSIEGWAFSGCTGLTSITIPDSVTSIGDYAFRYCWGLTSVIIGNGVTRIWSTAFNDCSAITSATMPTFMIPYIPQYSLQTVVLTSGESISSDAFDSCDSLISIVIPDTVTSIGAGAFRYCSGLTAITIPSGVTSIGYEAFCGCSSLTSITIPDGVTSMGYSSFEGCIRLTSVTIPDSVTSIGDSAFEGCIRLTSVTIPDSVTSIGYSAFSGCGSLTSVTIGNGVTSIGWHAFYGCIRLTFVTIPDSVTSIGREAFYNCSGLTSVTIPDSLTSIGYQAFLGCSSLTAIYYTGDMAGWLEKTGHEYVMSSGRTLYLDGNKVEGEIAISAGAVEIPLYAFAYQTGITSVTIPDSVTSIGDFAFRDCTGLTSVTIPDSVTSIGYAAFAGCSSLTSVNIPDSVTSIGGSTFSGCSSLTSVNIPDGVTSIGSSTFFGCSSLTSVVIPDGVTSIGSYVFSGCIGLTSITIPDSVTSIGVNAFRNCTNLIEKENGVSYVDGWVVDFDGSVSSVKLREGTRGIADRAFDDCTGLTSITIPDSVTSIGWYAFYGCSSLTSVKFKRTVGWYYKSTSTATSGTLPSSSLANSSTAAEWLTSTYCDYYWKCNV